MNQAKAKMEFQGQNDKDWSALTTFDEYLKDKKPNPLAWLKVLVKEYNNDENLKGVLEKIPSKSGRVHAALPQFREKQRTEVSARTRLLPTSMQKTPGL